MGKKSTENILKKREFIFIFKTFKELFLEKSLKNNHLNDICHQPNNKDHHRLNRFENFIPVSHYSSQKIFAQDCLTHQLHTNKSKVTHLVLHFILIKLTPTKS